jgi:hypothetical protein
MKRIRRRLFKALAVFPIVLCLMLAALWVRSYWVNDSVTYQLASGRRWNGYGISSDQGTIYAFYGPFNYLFRQIGPYYTGEQWEQSDPHRLRYVGRRSEPGDFDDLGSSYMRRRGFYFLFQQSPGRSASGSGTAMFDAILLPDWLLIAILLVPAAIAMMRVRRQARLEQTHHCVVCGYDLRGTPDRCPECGIAPSKLGRGG